MAKLVSSDIAKYMVSGKNLLLPGSKFKVSQKTDGIFTKDSQGFVSYFDARTTSGQFIKMFFVLTRRGKTGKQKLEWKYVKVAVTDIYKILTTDQNKTSDGDLFPTEANPFTKYFVYIKRLNGGPINLLDNECIDIHAFLGWGVAYASYLSNVISEFKNGSVRMWPNAQDHILNRIVKVPSSFRDYPTDTLVAFDSVKTRKTLIQELRRLESTVHKAILHHRMRVLKRKINSIAELQMRTKNVFPKKAFDLASSELYGRYAKLEKQI